MIVLSIAEHEVCEDACFLCQHTAKDLDTINMRIKLFDIFEGLLERPIIQASFRKLLMHRRPAIDPACQAELEKKHKMLLHQAPSTCFEQLSLGVERTSAGLCGQRRRPD